MFVNLTDGGKVGGCEHLQIEKNYMDKKKTESNTTDGRDNDYGGCCRSIDITGTQSRGMPAAGGETSPRDLQCPRQYNLVYLYTCVY